MNDLVAWIRPLIEARKATAEAAASSGAWDAPGSPVWRTRRDDSDRYLVQDSNGDVVVYDEGAPTEEHAAHMALNDPRQIVADCEKDLAILDRCEQVINASDWDKNDDGLCISNPIARYLARDMVRTLAWSYRHRDPDGYTEVAGGWTP